MRCLACYCIELKSEKHQGILGGEKFDYKKDVSLLTNIGNKLNIHIIVASLNGMELFDGKSGNVAPFITLFLSSRYGYSILYHQDARLLDKDKGEVNTGRYPFMYDPRGDKLKLNIRDVRVPVEIRNEPKIADELKIVEIIPSQIIELLKEMAIAVGANQIIHNKQKLKAKISAVMNLHQVVNNPSVSSVLQNLLNNLCDHNSTLFTPYCNNNHCIQCLYEMIQKNIAESGPSQVINCPCGVRLSSKNKDQIITFYNPKPEPKKQIIIDTESPISESPKSAELIPSNY